MLVPRSVAKVIMWVVVSNFMPEKKFLKNRLRPMLKLREEHHDHVQEELTEMKVEMQVRELFVCSVM